jgi:predicted GIY-YIG superfamily endonuclease
MSAVALAKADRYVLGEAFVMYHVYILRSVSHPTEHYVGFTEDMKQCLVDHNPGHCTHTTKHRPWELLTAISFSNRSAALDFERYLKTGSGRAFASRHFR